MYTKNILKNRYFILFLYYEFYKHKCDTHYVFEINFLVNCKLLKKNKTIIHV